MYVSYLSMGFQDTGNKKHRRQHRQENLPLLSNDGDWITFHRLPAYRLFLGSHFDGNAYLVWRAARIWTLLHEALKWIYRKYATTNDNTSFCRVFVVFSTKSSGKLIHEKPFGSKNVFKSPPWIWNKIKNTQFTQWINRWLSKDYRILAKPEGFPYFPICRIRQDKPEIRKATPSTTFQKCH